MIYRNKAVEKKTLNSYITAFQAPTKMTTQHANTTANLAGVKSAAHPCDSATAATVSITITALAPHT